MWGKADETINHIVSECTKLAQRESNRRHDWIERRGHCEICGAKGIPVTKKWCEHQPPVFIDNEI